MKCKVNLCVIVIFCIECVPYWFVACHNAVNEKETTRVTSVSRNSNLSLNFNSTLQESSFLVHAFYYAWYGNPKFDKKYLHWNRTHPVLGASHKSRNYIASNYYPKLGVYSSRDSKVIREHMKYFRMAGIGVMALSWYPAGAVYDESGSPDNIVPTILEIAEVYEIQVCFHIQPYFGRNATTVSNDIAYLNKRYGSYRSFYRTLHPQRKKLLPLVYIYLSHLTPNHEWLNALSDQNQATSIRNTDHDAIVIGLLESQHQMKAVVNSKFDGFYTYFASSGGLPYDNIMMSWLEISDFAESNNLIFIPTVAPGYINTNTRSWSAKRTKSRESGKYYDKAWKKALSCNPRFVSINSFNEWHQGTQLEPAARNVSVSTSQGLFHYRSYGNDSYMYLALTRKWVNTLQDILLGNEENSEK